MNLKNWVVDNIQMIITLSVFLICTYSSIFVKHNQITYLLLSVISIQALIILSKNSIFSKNKSSTKQLLSNSTTTDNSKKDSTPKQQKWIWLKNDKPLYDLCNEMKAIKNFNQHIYNTICDKMNRVSKKYYKELMKDDKNLYKNLDKHKIPIQFIEDSMKEIIELFREVEFTTTNTKYLQEYNIPDKIERFTDIINERLNLLKHKRGLR